MYLDRSRISRFPLALGILLLLSGTAAAAQGDATGLSATAYRIVPATRSQGLSGLVPVGGRVEARKSVILTAQLPGRIMSISGEEGDFFTRGSVLLQLDDRQLRAERRSAEAQWASAQTALYNASVQYNQAIRSPGSTTGTPGGMALPGMFDQMFLDPFSDLMGTRSLDVERGAQLYASNSQIDQAWHALEQAQAHIEQIDSKLRDAVSVAPFDGVIVDKQAEVGDTVQPGQPLLVFEDTGSPQIVIDIPVKLARSLREGDYLTARIEAYAIQPTVRVENIFPRVDATRHTQTVKFDLQTSPGIASGTYAEVLIPTASGEADGGTLTVPSTAVTRRGGLPVVFIVQDGNTAVMRLVRPGTELPGGRTVIDYGLSEGDRVIDAPPSHLVSGMPLSGEKPD